MPIRLVLADDHPLILDALEQLFSLERDFQVLGLCQDGVEALKAIDHYKPDVLILDLRMPRKDGRAVLRAMQQAQHPTRVVLLTAAVEESEVLEAISLGVHGVVLKEMAPYLLVECVRQVHAGGQWVERRSASQALNTLLHHRDGQRDVASILTRREQEIMRLVARGIRNQSIAEALCISEGTVKIHLHNIYKKLHLDSRVALSLYARDKGFN
jgi:DNA-binding NarL/FixJ family response regulator